jgi:hypothetical protein
MEQISLEEILKIIEERVENKDVSIFNACQDLLIAYHASIYPLTIEEDEYSLVAAATYYAALTNYGIEEDIEQVASLFGVKSAFSRKHIKQSAIVGDCRPFIDNA